MPGIRKYFELVKFSHTVFALPFALTAMLIAAGVLPDVLVERLMRGHAKVPDSCLS